MLKKVAQVIIGLLLIILGFSILVLTYFFMFDIETKEPSKLEPICNLEVEEYKNRKVFVVTPKDGKTRKTILYLHGGSYVAEATKEHWDFFEKLVKDTDATIIMPDYPLTPKYNYKDVFNMIEPLYDEIIKQVNPESLILMGDSAGGGMGLALLETIANNQKTQPSKTILISPWLDVKMKNPKIDEVQKYDKQLNKETLKIAGIAYAGSDGIDSYLVNPIEGKLENLQNVIIFTGTYDILNPDVHILTKKAEKVGTKIEVKEYEKAGHIWILSEKQKESKLAKNAYKELINYINN